MSTKRIGVVVTLACALFGVSTQARQHLWKSPLRGSRQVQPVEPVTFRPQAIGGGANGIYCPDMADEAVGVHDLGWLPGGRNVTVIVEANSNNGFDPAAAVVVPTLGEKAANSVKTSTFYDNDSAGDKNARVSFTAPQNGTYLLLVTDYTGKLPGCYRYQVDIR